MLRNHLLSAALILSVALLPLAASPADAVRDASTSVIATNLMDDQATTNSPRTMLVLTVSHADAHATPHAARSVVLTCDPAGGTHPEPQTSCGQLSAVRGDIAAMPFGEGRYCPKIFQPVTATATGWWSGNPIDYRQTFANSCLLELATGPLFHF